MKSSILLPAVLLLAACPLFAQTKAPVMRASPSGSRDTAPQEPERLELMPTRPAPLLPQPASLPLIPEIPMPAEPPRAPAESPIKKRDSVTADAEDAVKQRIRLREAKTKAQRDPAVEAEWDRAATMKTDYEKRAVLKNYYRLLYGRMARIDPSLKAPIDGLLREALGRLEQYKIAPTQPPAHLATGQRAAR